MSKVFTTIVAAVAVPVFALSSTAGATELPTGQVEGGNIYRAANLTKNTDFVDPASAVCGDTVQFRVRIHNIGAYSLENVKVQATLPSATATSHSSKVTVSASNGNTVTDTAGVNLAKAGKLVYVNGSTELLDANQSKLSGLNDGITGAGVTLSEKVGVSTQQKRSVQFKAKVVCETTPTTPGTPEAPETPETPKTETPQVIAATGPASTIATMFGLSALAAGIGYVIQRRRNILG